MKKTNKSSELWRTPPCDTANMFVTFQSTNFAQKHFLWTMVGPNSSYSPLEIHICWKVDREERIEPPIHTEYLRSGGAMILTFIDAGASAVISFDMRSAMPAYIVVPPESTTLAYRSLRMSTSHFMIELYVVSW